MPTYRTPEPAAGQERWDWPTTREFEAFRPGTGVVKLDHFGRGGWIHAIIWWVRDPNWNANAPIHFSQNHPVGASRGHAGSERFVGYGWESAGPAGADCVEVVFSAPDGAKLQFWRTS
jgi:hypothetical protein